MAVEKTRVWEWNGFWGIKRGGMLEMLNMLTERQMNYIILELRWIVKKRNAAGQKTNYLMIEWTQQQKETVQWKWEK